MNALAGITGSRTGGQLPGEWEKAMWDSLLRAWRQPESLQRNITNAVFGLLAVGAVVTVFAGIVVELFRHRRARRDAVIDPKRFESEGLGVTMADGGEPVDLEQVHAKTEPPQT